MPFNIQHVSFKQLYLLVSKGEEILDAKIWSMPTNNMLNRVRGNLDSSSTNSSSSTSSSLDPVASPLLITNQHINKDAG